MISVNMPRMTRKRFPARKVARRIVHKGHPMDLLGTTGTPLLPADYRRQAQLIYRHFLEPDLFTEEQRAQLRAVKNDAVRQSESRGEVAAVAHERGHTAYIDAIADILERRAILAEFGLAMGQPSESDREWWAAHSPLRNDGYGIVEPIPQHDARDWADYARLDHYDRNAYGFPFGHGD